MRRRSSLVSACAALSVMACIGPLSAAAPPAYDPEPWLEDLEQARAAFATKYANLEWAVLEREMNLSALFADTRTRVESATRAAEARAAFDRLARKLGDGHVRFQWPTEQAPAKTPRANCAALGYDASMQGEATAASIPGYAPLAGGAGNVFPAGLLRAAGHTLGLVQIGVFSPQGYPPLCEAALAALKIVPSSACATPCSDQIEAWGSERMSRDLERQLRAVKAAGADVLLVDLTDNGGGTEWAEAAARMVTAVRVKSERGAFVRGPHWSSAFEKNEVALRSAARAASAEDRALLIGFADEVAQRRRAAATPCDSTPLWQGERLACQWLGDGFYATGVLDSADPEQLRGKPWASLIFSPMQYPYHEGIWRGPLIVLVNGGTASAAEEFAAVLQDNDAAIVMGAPTYGAGCGHTDGGTPTTLKQSGGILELPDCARLRADGSNEVMGIQPDVLVGLRSADGPRRRGLRVAQKLAEAVQRATGRFN
jgi:hypothetical protein